MAIQIKSLKYFQFNIEGYFDGYNEITIQNNLIEIKKSKEDYLKMLPVSMANFL